jgi:transcription antitermination factor NusG
MKYLLMLLVLTTAACTQVEPAAPEATLKVGDKVKIIAGFYRGCTGVVTEYNGIEKNNQYYFVERVGCENADRVSSRTFPLTKMETVNE